MQLIILFPDQEQQDTGSTTELVDIHPSDLPEYTEIKPDITDAHIEACEAFIQRFTYIESVLTKPNALEYLRAQQKGKIKAVRDQWDYIIRQFMDRDRNFGSMFLSLDNHHQLLIIMTWGVFPDQFTTFQEYKRLIEDNDLAACFDAPPVPMQIIHNMVLFFCNHGISYNVAPGIGFQNIPPDSPTKSFTNSKCYGNTKNWAAHLVKYKALCKYDPAEYTKTMQALLSHYEIRVKQ